ncbi:electron transfer flavoprotein subunit alpha/FixB family protein [Adlercreutzia sp. ZJ138]|uniref:electron transfer flavoprotein subunit alpha/FixB family protein n=1 Tax=Adlercreutzia sp. ZJ138 TaxID=2709405 RepID=UPI0013EE104E|nr:electron transfer flavoprotein subunit alpha/FixB family protein [Adlercreutzia sp. ZJ138]
MKALVLAEHIDAAIELCAGARTMAEDVAVVCFGGIPEACADNVYVVRVPEGSAIDDAADSILPILHVEVVLVEPTRRMKIVAGKLAAAKNSAVVPGVIEFEDQIASNMYFGGVGVKKQKPIGTGFYMVGSGVFADAQASGVGIVEELPWVEPAKPLKIFASRQIEKAGVDLTKADVVVAAGRGFAAEEKLDMARDLCDKLGAGLGCTRPLTEGINWLPSELYIGVSGLMIAPKVFIAVGISGQMQHMVGCNRSDVIFAINKDENAPIFEQCDYGLVGDIETVLPALSAVL